MNGQVAVVTGAGRGIGRAIARGLAARGCDVALLGRTAGDLETLASEIVAGGGRALALTCDVASAGDVDRAKTSVLRELGAPRVVVNNAGVVRRSLVHETSEEEWDHVIGVNLRGTFLVTRAFLPSMLDAGRGRVVAVSSISATLGTARQGAYCASKWGVSGFMKALAEEVRGKGVQAITVLPGSVDTRMLEGSGFAPQMSPDDVAKVVAFVALDAPDAMNGSGVEVFGP